MILLRIVLMMLLMFTNVFGGIPAFKANDLKRAMNNINDFDELVLVSIGEYLDCPQKYFGLLNTYFHDMFMVKHPFREFVRSRHGIEDLLNAKSDKDLSIFSQLALVKDRAHLFKSLASHYYRKILFSDNEHLILSYLIKSKRELMAAKLLTDPASYGCQVLKITRRLTDFEHVIEVVKDGIDVESFCFDMSNGKLFMEQVLNIKPELYNRIERYLDDHLNPNEPFDQKQAGRNVYRHLLKRILAKTNYYDYFFTMSVLAGVPEELYFDLIVRFSSIARNRFLMQVLYFVEFTGTEAERQRIHGTIEKLLQLIPDTYDFHFFKLLNDIRYGTLNDIQGDLDHYQNMQFYRIVVVTALAKKYDLLLQIKRISQASQWKQMTERISKSEHGINIFFGLLEIYTEAEKEELFDGLATVHWILNLYDIDGFEYNPVTRRGRFILVLKPCVLDGELPSSFEFNLNCDQLVSKKSVFDSLAKAFFNQQRERNEAAVYKLLMDYLEYQAIYPRDQEHYRFLKRFPNLRCS